MSCPLGVLNGPQSVESFVKSVDDLCIKTLLRCSENLGRSTEIDLVIPEVLGVVLGG